MDKCTRAPELLPAPTPILFFAGNRGKFFRGYSREEKLGITSPSPGAAKTMGKESCVWVAQCNFSPPPPARALADGNVVEDLGRSRADKEEKSERADPGCRQAGG